MDTEREDTGWEDCGWDFVLREIFCEEEVRMRWHVNCDAEDRRTSGK